MSFRLWQHSAMLLHWLSWQMKEVEHGGQRSNIMSLCKSTRPLLAVVAHVIPCRILKLHLAIRESPDATGVPQTMADCTKMKSSSTNRRNPNISVVPNSKRLKRQRWQHISSCGFPNCRKELHKLLLAMASRKHVVIIGAIVPRL